MFILKVLEKVWFIAMLSAIAVGIYNFAKIGMVNHKVYFPLFIALSCFVLFLSIRNQIKFKRNFKKPPKV